MYLAGHFLHQETGIHHRALIVNLSATMYVTEFGQEAVCINFLPAMMTSS